MAAKAKANWLKLADVISTIDAEVCIEVSGFRIATEGETGYRFTDSDGVKKRFVIPKNKHNRPFRLRDAEEYGDLMFSGLWAGQWNHDSETGSGESWQVGKDGDIVSCAHRCVGLILAQKRRDLLARFGQTDLLEEFDTPEVITLPALLVAGVDEGAADTTDQPIGRTLGDVLYRKGIFPEKFLSELTPSQKAMLTRELATAIRLVWIRLRGQRVTGGDALPFPEALKFLETHPLISDEVMHIFNEDTAKCITSYISLGYAAGLSYLMAFSTTERKELETGQLSMTKRPKLMERAEEFWHLFGQANTKGVKVDSAPVNALANLLDKNKRSIGDKFSRDALCVLVCRAWEAFAGTTDRKVNDSGGLTRGLFKEEKDGEKVLKTLQFSRFGGFDVDREVLLDNGWIRKEEKLVRKAEGGWKIGDTLWVNDVNPEIQPWFGVLREFNRDPAIMKCVVESREEEDKLLAGLVNPWGGNYQYYEVELAWLLADRPAPKAIPQPEAPPAAPAVTAATVPAPVKAPKKAPKTPKAPKAPKVAAPPATVPAKPPTKRPPVKTPPPVAKAG